MKRLIQFIFFLAFVLSIHAQDIATGKRKVRPMVDLNVGTHYIFGPWPLPNDVYRCLIPYNTELSVGVAVPVGKGNVLIKSGVMFDGWYLKMDDMLAVVQTPYSPVGPNLIYVPSTHYHSELIINPNFLILGYEGFVGQKFSVYGIAKVGMFRFLEDHSWDVIKTTKYRIIRPNIWEYMTFQASTSIGFNYWFHPCWTLNVSLYSKMTLIDNPRYSIGTTIGISFR